MRKANTNDLFNIVRLIDHIGLKEEVFKVTKGTDDIERIGFDFIFELLIKATTEEAQKEINRWLRKSISFHDYLENFYP